MSLSTFDMLQKFNFLIKKISICVQKKSEDIFGFISEKLFKAQWQFF